MNKQIVITDMLSLTVARQYHVAGDCHHKRNDSLSDDLLQVLPLNQCSEQLNQILSHSLDPRGILIIVALKSPRYIRFWLLLTCP